MTRICATPTPYETLVALWTGELPPEEAEALEAHLFSCDSCAAASERLGQVVVGMREMIPPVLSHRRRDLLSAGGARIRETPVLAGRDADAHFTKDVDLLVHVLKGDLAGVDRVDLEVMDEHKRTTYLQFQHVPFDPTAGEVLIACQRHFEHMFSPPGDPVFRVTAYQKGARRLVGDYFVRHHWE